MNTIKTSGVITALNFVQVVLTFGFQVLIINIYGVGEDLDIYYGSNTLNIIFVAVATGALNFAISPIFIVYYKNKRFRELREVANSLFNTTLVLFVLFAAVQIIFADEIIKLILPGFEVDQLNQVIYYFKIQAAISTITVLNALLVALLYASGKLNRTIVIPIFSQILQIVFVLFFFETLGIGALVFGNALYHFVTLIIQGYSYAPFYRPKIVFNQQLLEARNKIFPLLFSSFFSKSNILVDRFFSSTLLPGSITLLQYAQRIIQILSGLLNKGLSIVTLRSFSLASDEGRFEFHKKFLFAYKVIIFIVVPIASLIVFFIDDALKMLLFSDRINEDNISSLSLVILSLLGILVGGNLTSIIANAFYSLGLTHIVSRLSVSLHILGIALKIILFQLMGFYGLPIAFSITSILNSLILLILYNRIVYKYQYSDVVIYLLKISVFSFVTAGLVSMGLEYLLVTLWWMRLIFGGIIFAICYAYITYFFEKEVSLYLWKNLRKRR